MKLWPLIAFALFVTSRLVRAEERVTVDFYQTDIREVLVLYEKLTGLHVAMPITAIGTVNAKSNGPVTKEKAVEILEAGLFASDFPILQLGPDKVELLAIGKMATSYPLPTITKLDELPKNERVVRYVYKLKAREPKSLQKVLQLNLTPKATGIPWVTMDEEARAIIIIDQCSALPGIVKLIDELDVPAK